MFTPTHACKMQDGTLLDCRVLRLDPPFAYGRQAIVEFKDEPGENYRVGLSRLTRIENGALDEYDGRGRAYTPEQIATQRER